MSSISYVDGQYRMAVSESQVKKIRELNTRAGEGKTWQISTMTDVVGIVPDFDVRVDMLLGQWFGMVIGILPDGSSHS